MSMITTTVGWLADRPTTKAEEVLHYPEAHLLASCFE